MSKTKWNVFISYASEDKAFADTLANALANVGLRVWFDKFELQIGDSLRRSIDHGLSSSRYGIVILSPNFFMKDWPQKELDGLLTRETRNKKVILPIWHNVSAQQIRQHSPMLADRVAINSNIGLDQVVKELLKALNVSASQQDSEPVYTRAPEGYIGVNLVILDEFDREADRLVISVNKGVTLNELVAALSKELPDLLPQTDEFTYTVSLKMRTSQLLNSAIVQEGSTLIVRQQRIG